jgi:hypothetical protein
MPNALPVEGRRIQRPRKHVIDGMELKVGCRSDEELRN